MVPAAFVTVEGMPLTTAGKVDRAALRKFSDPPAVKTESATPRDAVEESVAAIWSEILGVEVIGVHDNFFELGGHSLLATRVISAIRQIFKMELPLKTLFESATVEQFAAAVSGAEARPGQAEKIARVYMKMRRMSAEDRERALRQKRQERNQ
jgi:acyl carrier protein